MNERKERMNKEWMSGKKEWIKNEWAEEVMKKGLMSEKNGLRMNDQNKELIEDE